MSDIEQVYCKAPDESSFKQDLLNQGLAIEDKEGNVQSKFSANCWIPLKQEDDPSTDTDESVEADYVLVRYNVTKMDPDTFDSLKEKSPLDNGTKIDVDVSSLRLHSSEPHLTTYGV